MRPALPRGVAAFPGLLLRAVGDTVPTLGVWRTARDASHGVMGGHVTNARVVAAATALLGIGVGAVGCQQTDQSPTLGAPSRTVRVVMQDSFRYEPAELVVKAGEVVRFEVVNAGTLPHEFLVGDADRQEGFEREMADGGMGGMDHGSEDGPLPGVMLEAGGTDSFVFSVPAKAGELIYACHVPGHYAAGMRGRLTVE
jgi:uncharacterized cupredoxin-like copper-binding protein